MECKLFAEELRILEQDIQQYESEFNNLSNQTKSQEEITLNYQQREYQMENKILGLEKKIELASLNIEDLTVKLRDKESECSALRHNQEFLDKEVSQAVDVASEQNEFLKHVG